MNIQERMSAAEIKRNDDAISRRNTVQDLVRLWGNQNLGRLIEIEVNAENKPIRFVAEVVTHNPEHGGVPTSLWAVGANGTCVSERFLALDEALIASVAYQHLAHNEARYAVRTVARGLGIEVTK